MKKIKASLSNLKENISNKITRIKKEHLISLYIKNNILFLTFVITAVFNSTILRFFCMHMLENYLSFKAILADVTVAVIYWSFWLFI